MSQFWETAARVDERMRDLGIPYCIIKTYGGHEEYRDGNLDVLVDHTLLAVAEEVFDRDFHVTSRDRFKHAVYEQNKLMLNSNELPYTPLHLHRSVGWHNLCCIPAHEVIENAEEKLFDGRPVQIASRDDEARIFVLHIVLEQFRVKPWDLRLLERSDFDSFAADYGIDDDEIAVVRDATEGAVSTADLRPIWRKYYKKHSVDSKVSVWNRFLHWVLLVRSGRLKA
ncbi:MAG: hypothetical protein GY910_25020 [bacterium]|nr:hypothetical protein [Deltaproteobacteria bacterium]MCP4908248.1 hypothetical protein [bacterium]